MLYISLDNHSQALQDIQQQFENRELSPWCCLQILELASI